MITVAQLLAESHLPGPRANLALLKAFAAEADEARVQECLGLLGPETADSPQEFAGMCGVLGGALLRGEQGLAFARPYASHPSWRVRETVAMAIQELTTDLGTSLDRLVDWTASPLEQRAVVAGLCEPRLLGEPVATGRLLDLLAGLTRGFDHDRRLSADEQVLRQALGYAWSVAVAAHPEGRGVFGELLDCCGKHVVWILRENLKKTRLVRMSPLWVEELQSRLRG